MKRPDIESIEKQLKRGTGYRRMQGTALQLILWIKELEADQALMIKKFDEDFENAVDFHLEEEAKKKRNNELEE